MFARILCLFYLKFSTCCPCIPHRYSCYNSILHLSHAFTYYKMCSCAWWSWTLVSTLGVSGCEQMRTWEAESCLRQSQQKIWAAHTESKIPVLTGRRNLDMETLAVRAPKRPCKVAICRPKQNLRGNQTGLHLDLELLTSRTLRKLTVVV